ncbi:MAG: four helix bundle protein [Clostridia bacterium]|nr:four helix bundle protein [Clostridia bacterium]
MAFTSYKELTVWKKAMDLTDIIYALTKKLPKEETFAISDQMRRAVVSIPSNIAEGQGRQTEKEFRNFLSMARGSCYEIQTQLLICERQHYLTSNDIKPALILTEEIGKMLTTLIIKLKTKN